MDLRGVPHTADIDALMVGGANAAGGGPAAEGGGDAAAADGPDVAAQGGVGDLALGRLLRRQLLGQLHDLRLDGRLLGRQVVHVLLVLALALAQLLHQGVGRLPLLVQLCLLADQLRLGGLGGRLLVLQVCFFLLDLHLEGLEVVDDPLVGVHDLVDDIQPAQQVREAGGFEQH